jgi:hypothetical protein
MAIEGRPTDYDPKYIKEIYQYMMEAVPENMAIATVEGFALKIDVTKKTLYNWSKKHKEFLHALRILKMRQREQLISIGIFGGKEINANIVALMLRANHDMVERTKTDITSGGEKLGHYSKVEDSQLDEIIKDKIRQIGIAGVVGGEGTPKEN